MKYIIDAARPGAVALAPPPSAILSGFVSAALARLAAFARACAEAREQRRRARETVRRLMALSNRELKDIGINRSEILSLAYGPGDGRRVRKHGHD